MQMDRTKLFNTPFSKEYWHQALKDFKNLRMLVFAALMVAIRVALKPVGIPIAADLRINVGFFVNAYGAMVFGPVVAILAAVVSDTLGYLVYPNGVYFLPFVIVEVAGSLIFALFLYRTEVSALRVVLSRFCVNVLVNIVLNTPIMALYYKMILGRTYALFDLLRVVKNLALFPVESILLIFFLRLAIPPTQKLGYIFSGVDRLRFTKPVVAALAALLMLSTGLISGYAVYNYNTTSLSASYTAEERLMRNQEMTEWAKEEMPEGAGDDLVVIVESARSKVGIRELTYELALYKLDRAGLESGSGVTEQEIRGYSKSKAAKEPLLTRIGSASAVTNKKTGEHLTLSLTIPEAK